MKRKQRHFKVELEIIDKAFRGEHLYTTQEIKKLIKTRLPFTLDVKKLKVKEGDK